MDEALETGDGHPSAAAVGAADAVMLAPPAEDVEPGLQGQASAAAWHVACVLAAQLRLHGRPPARAVLWRDRGVGLGFAGYRYPCVAIDMCGEVRLILGDGDCAVGVSVERICEAFKFAKRQHRMPRRRAG